jgi:hypothetical protein
MRTHCEIFQLISEARFGNGDQRLCLFAQRLAMLVRDALLGHNNIGKKLIKLTRRIAATAQSNYLLVLFDLNSLH